jgi:hypothetical protein
MKFHRARKYAECGYSEIFPYLPVERDAEALEIYHNLFGDRPLAAWTKEGTRLTYTLNGRLLSFAPRRTHVTVGFRGHAAIEFYRFIGGECRVGEVTIKIPYSDDWNPGPVNETISWYSNN